MTSVEEPTADNGRTHPSAADDTSPDSPPVPHQDEVTDPEAQAVTEAALLEAFGGVRGLVETTVPGLVFILIYTINKDIDSSAIAALVLSALMGTARLVRKGTVKHAFSGVFGVVVGVAFAKITGNAKDFYLPGMLYGLGLSLAYLLSAVCGFPLLGVILGPVFKENLSWRNRNPGRKRAYVKASYAWGFIFLGKAAILFPLYWWADPTKFGWVTVGLKIPPLLLAVYLTWIFLAKAPPPINVIAEWEAEEAAEKAAKNAAAEGENDDGRDVESPATPVVGESRERGPRHRRR